MNLRFFIDRPVFSGVISVVIVLLGMISMFSLPVEQYPDIAPPTINVFATYPGANAETVQKAVITPLEEAINGVEDMTYMTSTASNTGDASINIYFKQGTNADMAAVNVQNRVNGALSQLPAEATKTGVTTEKQQNAELMTFALYSPDDRFDQTFLNNYVKINVEPRLKRISGVGKAQLFGSNYSMRLWLRPDKMAQYGLIPDDISTVLARQNIEAATGSFGANHPTANEYTMKYRGRLSGAEEFGELVIKSLPGGNVLRLKEVPIFGDKALFENASFQIPLGAKVALTGGNGTGKTTLIQMILNHEEGISISPKAKIGYFAQNGYKYNSNQNVMEFMQEDCDYNISEIRSVLASMGFKQNDIGKSLSVLSGGEIIKLLLAKMLMGRYNILLMDEPSNFLDIPSLEALEILMKEYAGTIVFITHDKRLLENVADVVYEIRDKKINLKH